MVDLSKADSSMTDLSKADSLMTRSSMTGLSMADLLMADLSMADLLTVQGPHGPLPHRHSMGQWGQPSHQHHLG